MENFETINSVLGVKVGSGVLLDRNNINGETLSKESFDRIGNELAYHSQDTAASILVSSAAITAGMIETGLTERPSKESQMPELQRLASIGWHHIVSEWDDSISNSRFTTFYQIAVGGLLLTKSELDADRPERDEALRTIYTMLRNGDIPVINENDTITHKEIEFGDNDILSGHLFRAIAQSALFGSDLKLILLTDVDGLYEDAKNKRGLIKEVNDINQVEHLISGEKGKNSTGGMLSKIICARLVTTVGVDMWVANGREEHAISKVLDGNIGTHFVAQRV